jgi:hypothetical protein
MLAEQPVEMAVKPRERAKAGAGAEKLASQEGGPLEAWFRSGPVTPKGGGLEEARKARPWGRYAAKQRRDRSAGPP